MDAGWSRARFASARVARLATVGPDGHPHLVPIVFALVGDAICTVVDGKPKAGTRLRRLDNIRANPAVSVLVDEYADDWDRLWWARADGLARIVPVDDAAALEPLAALVERYPPYRSMTLPGPLVVIDVRSWSGWAAKPGDG